MKRLKIYRWCDDAREIRESVRRSLADAEAGRLWRYDSETKKMVKMFSDDNVAPDRNRKLRPIRY